MMTANRRVITALSFGHVAGTAVMLGVIRQPSKSSALKIACESRIPSSECIRSPRDAVSRLRTAEKASVVTEVVNGVAVSSCRRRRRRCGFGAIKSRKSDDLRMGRLPKSF